METIVYYCLAFRLLLPHFNTIKKTLALLLQCKIHMSCRSAERRCPLPCKKVISCCCSAEWHIKVRMAVNTARHQYKSGCIDYLGTVST